MVFLSFVIETCDREFLCLVYCWNEREKLWKFFVINLIFSTRIWHDRFIGMNICRWTTCVIKRTNFYCGSWGTITMPLFWIRICQTNQKYDFIWNYICTRIFVVRIRPLWLFTYNLWHCFPWRAERDASQINMCSWRRL